MSDIKCLNWKCDGVLEGIKGHYHGFNIIPREELLECNKCRTVYRLKRLGD